MPPPKPPLAFVGIAAWQDHEAVAVGALARGEANEQQQRDAFAWILNVACARNEIAFVPGDPQSGPFIAGRQFAGSLILKLAKLSVADINRAKEAHQR